MHPDVILILLALTLATVTSVAGGVVVRHVAPTIGAVVPPRNDRWHSAPTPTMGGTAIAAGTIVGFAVILAALQFLDFTAPWLPVQLWIPSLRADTQA